MSVKSFWHNIATTLFSGMFLLSSGASLGSSISLSQLTEAPLVDTVSAASHAVELTELAAPEARELAVAESYSGAAPVNTSRFAVGAGGVPVVSYHNSADFADCNGALNNVPASGARACVGATNTFLFGHNSYDTFRPLYGVGVGDTITYNGANYRVMNVVAFPVSSVPMNAIVYGYYGGGGYNLSLMTCYGAGDSQRLVVFAVAE